MRRSLKLKLTLTLAGLMAFMILTLWLINRTFLQDYYQYSKLKSLSDCFGSVNELLGSQEVSELSDENNNRIEHIEEISGLSVYLISEGSDDHGPYIKFLYPNDLYMKDAKTRKFERVRNALFQYIFAGLGAQDDTIEILRNNEGVYDIYKIFDRTVESSFIDLLGKLDNGTLIFIRANFDSIEEGADISNKFLTFVGLAVMVFGALMMYVLSRGISRPIEEMSDIAKKMKDLDFDTKYSKKRKDEIGELGESINELSEKLEKTISELKSANIELQRDNEEKTQIDAMRREFLSNVSHELKTPIALIQGYAEGLKENVNDDTESREFYCDVIIDESQKMNSMVKKLLSLNQIESGNNRLELERFDITSLVESVVASQDILIRQKGIRVDLNSNEPTFVWADEFMIEEVVSNYISNAVNHAEGDRVIDIRFIKNGNTVRIAVFNTGRPIPPEDLDKIWIKFYKVDKARTREYGGNGIGLSIVKAVMDAHGREYGVINHENGVEFWFELDCGK